MRDIERALITEAESKHIDSYYRLPNIVWSGKSPSDFIVIMNSGFSLYIEAKQTIGKRYQNIFTEKKLHQVLLNKKLQTSTHSRHVYILGVYDRILKKNVMNYYVQDMYNIFAYKIENGIDGITLNELDKLAQENIILKNADLNALVDAIIIAKS